MPATRSVSATERQIGQLLVEGGFLNKEDLHKAVSQAEEEGRALREVLVAQGYISNETYATFVGIQTRVLPVDLRQVQVDQEVLRLVPEELARQYRALPVGLDPDGLRVAMDDPINTEAIQALRASTGRAIKPRLAVHGSVLDLIHHFYRSTPKLAQDLKEVLRDQEDGPRGSHATRTVAATAPTAAPLSPEAVARAPVVQALDMLLTQAIKDRASDIHIEPLEAALRIRYRIDGVLYETVNLPKGIHPSLVSRIKVLSGMDVAERRRPQDGRFSMRVDNEEYDFRVASIDTANGEKVVVRILTKSGPQFSTQDSLKELGLQPAALTSYQRLLHSPYGMVLVSGPTGAGKTTTLYTSLTGLDALANNIMTIEDPVEYRFKGISQIQVNEEAGISFAGGLRGLMRMDPDIILVGEVRDAETAGVAVQAALTGHLVLSSIHANDSASAVLRLIDLGVEPYLVTSAVVGSVAQRLVRKVCSYCKTPAQPSPAEAAAYESEMGEPLSQAWTGKGCNLCARSGYMGRLGVFEVLVVNDAVRRLIARSATSPEIKAEAVDQGMITMRQDGMLKAKEGVTTVAEVIRNVFVLE
ncbi:MAG: Flp pilus assembly complex ATPase component TadA [Chloroflexi bacterium]|nr:Flp pilus assembly complex ATPase component TadA [Chloroflexota bacterium]